MGEDGKLITESLKDFTKFCLLKEYRSLDDFLKAWNYADKKAAVVKELTERGVFFDELQEEVGKDIDPFDLICHIAYGKPPLTRKERVENVKKHNYFAKYEGKAQEVIEALLEKYADQGLSAIDDIGDLSVTPFTQFGMPYEIVNDIFGGRDEYLDVIDTIQQQLYT